MKIKSILDEAVFQISLLNETEFYKEKKEVFTEVKHAISTPCPILELKTLICLLPH